MQCSPPQREGLHKRMADDVLRNIPLFASLPEGELEQLMDGSHTKRFPEGSSLLLEGERDERLLVVLDGEVEVVKALGTPEERQLAVRAEGTVLGELGLFGPEGTHSATVRARSSVTALSFSAEDLEDIIQRHPSVLRALLSTVSERLHDSEEMTIRDLREKNRQLRQAYEELRAAQAELIEKERMERELEVARSIQRSLLPERPPAVPEFDFSASMSPMDAVGGDFYDFFEIGGRVGIAVGDVSDHGVAAALLMAQVVTLLRSEARQGADPAHVLRSINRELGERQQLGMFVTVLYGILDPSTRSFDYVRAGHSLPILHEPRAGASTLPAGRGQPLGMTPDPSLDAGSLTLPQDAVLLLYTDGVTEAMNEEGDLFGEEGVVAFIQRMAADQTADDICRELQEELRAFRGGAAQQDDVTSVVIKAK